MGLGGSLSSACATALHVVQDHYGGLHLGDRALTRRACDMIYSLRGAREPRSINKSLFSWVFRSRYDGFHGASHNPGGAWPAFRWRGGNDAAKDA